MTILDSMLPPPTARDDKLDELIEVTSQRVSMMTSCALAQAGAHEYDEEIVSPPQRGAGATFLHEAAQAFVRWINREGRFPQPYECAEVASVWHREQASGTQAAIAFVELGLFYSQHADVARGARVEDFRRVLDEVAEQIVVTLTEDYGPLV